MNKKNLVIMLACAVLTFIGLIPDTWAERGVTDTEIRIGQWGPQTGPAALWGAVARGTGCYFDMINAEGGIQGRKIKYFLRDDAYQPPKTKAIAKELVEYKKVFAFASGVGTATGMAVKKYLHKKGVPWVGPASGSTYWAYPPTKYLFAVYPLYCDEAAILIDYAVGKLGKKRIAFFYQNDDYGKEGLRGAEDQLAKHNMELVAKVSVEITDTDLSSHALKLRESEADAVIMWLLPKQAAMILKEASKIDFKPKWLTSSTLGDVDVMYKITEGLWEGVIFDYWAELPNSDHPLMIKYRAAQEKYAPKERWSTFFAAGFVFAEPLVEGLRRAGRNITREKFVKAMESLDNWNGGTAHNITYGPNLRQGMNSIFIAKCENGRAVRISDWMEMEE